MAFAKNAPCDRSEITTSDVEIPPHGLKAILTVPQAPKGIVVFSHGSGSSRLSPRNAYVASALNSAGFATLLLDLLQPVEDRNPAYVFDISLLSQRLTEAVEWVNRHPDMRELDLGLFGASTGAAAALRSAVNRPDLVAAVVSRGGRPDLADDKILEAVQAPTLMIVGGEDRQVLAVNENALLKLSCDANLEIIPGATHLFEESGALEAVVDLAIEWFERRLAKARGASYTL